MTVSRSFTPNIHFTRINDAPLLVCDSSLGWEAGGIFAPAVIREGNKWKMLYRAYGDDKISRLGYAESDDGITWQKDNKPRVIPDDTKLEYSGVEDPRIVFIDNQYLITYTGYSRRAWRVKTRIRILITSDFQTFKRITPSLAHRLKNNKNGVLFPEKLNGSYVMLHRLAPNIQISTSIDLEQWSKYQTLLRPTKHKWESKKIGAGAPPIKTDIGWLLFYHGVDKDGKYSMGAAILAVDDPTTVLYRLPFPLLSPDAPYEKDGVIPNVVFGTSVIEVDPNYRLYYGGADKVIAAASINKSLLLDTLKQYPAE